MINDLTILALLLITIVRVTRLIVVDKLTAPIRTWVARRLPDGNWFTYLIHCQACASVWVAFAVTPPVIALANWEWWWYPLIALTGSQVTVLLTHYDTT